MLHEKMAGPPPDGYKPRQRQRAHTRGLSGNKKEVGREGSVTGAGAGKQRGREERNIKIQRNGGAQVGGRVSIWGNRGNTTEVYPVKSTKEKI